MLAGMTDDQPKRGRPSVIAPRSPVRGRGHRRSSRCGSRRRDGTGGRHARSRRHCSAEQRRAIVVGRKIGEPGDDIGTRIVDSHARSGGVGRAASDTSIGKIGGAGSRRYVTCVRTLAGAEWEEEGGVIAGRPSTEESTRQPP